MKYPASLLFGSLIILASCGKSTHEHDHSAMAGDSASSALNTLIMSKHDEVMPKMGDLYNLKKKLQDSIAHTPSMPAAKKSEFEALIASLDSANTSMRDWMHGYDPTKDSTDQEKNRIYLEGEIESINKIAEQTTEIISKAKEAIGGK